MTPEEIVARFTTYARSNFVKLRAGLPLTGNQLNGLKLRGVVVWQDFPAGWICDPTISEALDRRWPKDPCDKHLNTNLPYLTACADAETRLKRGEQQQQCTKCGKWIWQELFTDPAAMGMTERYFRHASKQR